MSNLYLHSFASHDVNKLCTKRFSIIFFLCAAIVLFNYYDVYHHYWLLRLIDGYVIKAWLPPTLLLLLSVWQRYRSQTLKPSFAGLKYPTIFLSTYILFGSISLVWNEEISNVIKYGLTMFGPVTVFLSVLLTLDTNQKVENVIHCLFWSGVCLSAYVVYMYDIRGYPSWVGEPYVLRWMWTHQETHEVLAINYHSVGDFFEFSKTLKLIDETAFSAMLAPLAIYGFFKASSSSKWQSKLYFLPSFFLLYTLLNTTSRSSFIAFLSGLFPFLWSIRRKWKHVLLILFATGFLLYSNTFMLYRLALLSAAVYSKTTGDNANIPAWMAGIEKALKRVDSSLTKARDPHIESVSKTFQRTLQHPLVGYGMSNLLEAHAAEGMSWHLEHNRYLSILSTSGMLTVTPYILTLMSLLFLAYKHLAEALRQRPEHLNLGVIIFPAVLLFILQINNCSQERYYYWVFLALAAAWIRNQTLSNRSSGQIS
jgi:hypothetical protein